MMKDNYGDLGDNTKKGAENVGEKGQDAIDSMTGKKNTKSQDYDEDKEE